MHRRRYALLALGLMVAGTSGAWAAHVVPMSLETLADHAGQVIDGEVVSVRSYWAEDPRRIESEIVFRQVEYLKGGFANADDAFVLRVPGGTVGEMQMRLCCAPQFATGERWILFLLPSSPMYPVVGLHQGALRVVEEDDILRVQTADARPVVGVDDAGMVQAVGAPRAHASPASHDAHNVRIAPRPEAPVRAAMRYVDLRATLQPILDASRDHGLRSPAGAYTPIRYTPTALKSAEQVKQEREAQDATATTEAAEQPAMMSRAVAHERGKGVSTRARGAADKVQTAPADERDGRAE